MIKNNLIDKEFPIKKYEDERYLIKEQIVSLLSSKCLPEYPLASEDNSCIECMELNKKLFGRHYSELDEIDQRLFTGDLYFLNENAFRYYIFEVILYLYENDFINADIVIQYFFWDEFNKKRFTLFDRQEIEIILLFLKNLAHEIDDVIGDKTIYSTLKDWEQEEVYHPMKPWKDDINMAIEQWEDFNLSHL